MVVDLQIFFEVPDFNTLGIYLGAVLLNHVLVLLLLLNIMSFKFIYVFVYISIVLFLCSTLQNEYTTI